MSTPAKPFPLTLPGVCAYGIEEWLRDYRPVLPAEEFHACHDRMFAAYTNALAPVSTSPELHACAVARYKLPDQLTIWWFELRRRLALIRAGIAMVHDRGGLASPPAEVASLRQHHPMLSATQTESFRHCCRERLIMMRYNWRSHSPLTAWLPGCYGVGGYLLGDPKLSELLAYVADHSLHPLLLRPIGCLGCPPQPAPEDQVEAATFADRFWQYLAPDTLADGEVFNADLRQAFTRHFAVNLAWFRQGRKRLQGWRDGELLLTSVGHFPSRMFAGIWRHLGRNVTGFTHGNNYTVYSPGSNFLSGANLPFNRFVVSSAGERLLADFVRQTYQGPFSSSDHVEQASTSVFRDIFRSLQAWSPIRAIRTVMVIGFSMDYHYYRWLPTYDTLTYAHLSLRLLQALREAGYRVIYKDHPNTCAEAAELFRGRADEILTVNFTECLQQADCLFYVTPFSTTLGYGLLSRIPAVIVDNRAWNYWHPEILSLLKRRAALFPVAPDAHGVLQFNPATLPEIVQSSLTLTDTALVEKWAM